jgi:hypothetical protein
MEIAGAMLLEASEILERRFLAHNVVRKARATKLGILER